MDSDLVGMSKEELIAESKRLRSAIREHRDSSGHDLCWHHPKLWSLLPEKVDPTIEIPEWSQFMRGCVHYRESLDQQAQSAKRTTKEFGDK